MVKKQIVFNGSTVWVTARIIREIGDEYLVEFDHGGVQFRGLWKKSECLKIGE